MNILSLLALGAIGVLVLGIIVRIREIIAKTKKEEKLKLKSATE